MSIVGRARELSRLSPAAVRDRLTFARLDESLRVRRAMTRRGAPSPDELVIHPRALGGAAVRLRVGTADPAVAWDTFVGRYHLPPPEAGTELRRIWDLGANIGLTVAHYAALHPLARVTGVELDDRTAARAVANIRPWSDRCSIVVGAVWFEDGEVSFERTLGREHATHVGAGEVRVGARSLNSLMADDDIVDFVKMDIEGAERQLLTRNTEWAAKVRTMKVELHGDYGCEEAAADLGRLGFTTRRDEHHWAALVAVR